MCQAFFVEEHASCNNDQSIELNQWDASGMGPSPMPVLMKIVIIVTSLLKLIFVFCLEHQLVQGLLQFQEGVKIVDFLETDPVQRTADLVVGDILGFLFIQPQT